MVDEATRVTDAESFSEFMNEWYLGTIDPVLDDLHIDTFLARLSKLAREYDDHLVSGAEGEPPGPTWRWYAEILVRAVHGLN